MSSTGVTTLEPPGARAILTDGTVYTIEDLEAAEAYIDGIMPLLKEQFEIVDILDSVHRSERVPDALDAARYSDALQRQRGVWKALRAIEAPAELRESHDARTLAADYFSEAATRIRKSWDSLDATLLAEGTDLYQMAYETWRRGESLLAKWEESFQGAEVSQ